MTDSESNLEKVVPIIDPKAMIPTILSRAPPSCLSSILCTTSRLRYLFNTRMNIRFMVILDMEKYLIYFSHSFKKVKCIHVSFFHLRLELFMLIARTIWRLSRTIGKKTTFLDYITISFPLLFFCLCLQSIFLELEGKTT